jgi:hypothetical protein
MESTTTFLFFAASFGSIFLCSAQPQIKPTDQTQSAAQTGSQENERGTIKSEEFTNSRPAGSNQNRGRYRYRQHPKTTVGKPSRGQTYATIGVTIARGRAATEAESKNDSIAKVRSDGRELVFERISDSSPVQHGTLIQMMIEYLASPDAAGKHQSNQIGYLYVINRVQYADGKFGPARLIFPTSRTYGGDNRVLPGKTVMLPAPNRPWQITRSKSGAVQTFETYTIVISPAVLTDNQGRELQGDENSGQSLEALVIGWTRIWGGAQSRGDLERGEGVLITQREQAASGEPSARQRDTGELDSDLTQDDPPPQMIFSKVLRPGSKILVTIKLPFKEAAAIAAPKP